MLNVRETKEESYLFPYLNSILAVQKDAVIIFSVIFEYSAYLEAMPISFLQILPYKISIMIYQPYEKYNFYRSFSFPKGV